MLYFVTENCVCVSNERDVIIRTEALKRCYAIDGYKELALDEKNAIYDRIVAEVEREV